MIFLIVLQLIFLMPVNISIVSIFLLLLGILIVHIVFSLPIPVQEFLWDI